MIDYSSRRWQDGVGPALVDNLKQAGEVAAEARWHPTLSRSDELSQLLVDLSLLLAYAAGAYGWYVDQHHGTRP